MTRQTIISLAMLKANWDQSPDKRTDYLDSFVPFIADSIRVSNAPVVALADVQRNLLNTFGINLPQHVINGTLTRVERAGFITQENGVYKPVLQKLSDLPLAKRQQEFQRTYSALIQGFIEFSKEQYRTDLTEDDAEIALTNFLETNHQMYFILRSRLRGTVIPYTEMVTTTKRYLVAKYVQHIESANPQEFEYLETVVKGLMVANAVFLPDVETATREFTSTKVFLDTPLLIYALGYAGESLQRPCLEMLDLLRASKAELCCFEHSVAEAHRIFHALATQIESDASRAFGPSVEYFLSRKVSSSDILEIAERFPEDIAEMGVCVVKKPVPKADNFMIGEAALENAFKPYANPRALTHDVVSISSIYRLREGQEFYRLEDCMALFVTNNRRLVNRVRAHFSREFNNQSIALAITDQSVTNMVWLKMPTQAPNLARDRIIADCYAAIQPSEELWNRFVDNFEALNETGEISEDRYYALRYATVTRTALMDVTLGEEEAFTQGTTYEIIDLATQRLREEDIQRASTAEQTASNLQRQLALANDRRDKRAHVYAGYVTAVLKIAYMVILGILTLVALPLNLASVEITPVEQEWLRWIATIFLALFWLASLLDMAKGIRLIKFSVVDMFDNVEDRIYGQIRDFLE